MDTRAQIVDIGILNSDAFSIAVVIEQKDTGEAASHGAAFGGLLEVNTNVIGSRYS